MNDAVIDYKIRSFSKTADIVQTILIYLLCLSVPTFLGGLLVSIFGNGSVIALNSQLIVGSIVNFILIVSAMNLSGNLKILGVVTMPSISTILSGYVFQSSSPFMIFMVPAIWLGNFMLIYIYKYMLKREINYFLTGISGVLIKVLIIYSYFSILCILDIFPVKIVNIFSSAMGMMQVITGFIGVLLAFPINKLEKDK